MLPGAAIRQLFGPMSLPFACFHLLSGYSPYLLISACPPTTLAEGSATGVVVGAAAASVAGALMVEEKI